MRAMWRVLAAVACFGGAIGMLRVHDGLKGGLDYMSVPAVGTTRMLVAGFENMAADGLYLQFVHYFGKHLRDKQKYYNIYPVVALITDLDPHFEGAYVMGAMALGDNGQAEDSEAIWAKGVAHNPTSWSFAYQAGMALFLFGDTPEQYMRAAALFRKAASLPGARPEARFMEARMYDVANRRALAVAVWTDTYLHAPSAEMRGVAERTLKNRHIPLPPRLGHP